jgi:hypothetical protein
VPEFSFITVNSKEVFDAFMAVKSDASGFDGIPLSFLSKVCEVLMAGQMNGHIRNFGSLCPF